MNIIAITAQVEEDYKDACQHLVLRLGSGIEFHREKVGYQWERTREDVEELVADVLARLFATVKDGR